jgi:hypothetical protein
MNNTDNGMDRALKWVGVGTLTLGALPVTAVLVREIPGMIREVKIARMGFRGGWKQAH